MFAGMIEVLKNNNIVIINKYISGYLIIIVTIYMSVEFLLLFSPQPSINANQ